MLLTVVLTLLCSLAASAQEPVTITFQYRSGEGRAEAVQAWIEEFEREHPHIKVEWLQPPSDYRERTLISWASGTGPDVIEIWGDWAQDYAAGWRFDGPSPVCGA